MRSVSLPHQTHKHWPSERLAVAAKTTGGAKAPPFFMDDLEIIIKTSEFYETEAERLLKKLRSCSTEKQKLKTLAELSSLKQKIKFEINQICKILEEGGDY